MDPAAEPLGPPTAEDFAALLKAEGHAEASVTIVGVASAGATRQTLLLEIEQPGTATAAVAQISAARVTDRAIDAEGEAQIVTAAGRAGVPVAEVLAATDAFAGGGRSALICRRVSGETIPRRVLRTLSEHGGGENLTIQCGDALGALHRVPVTDLPAELAVPPVAEIHARYVYELEGWLTELPHPEPVLRYGINWLRAHLPSVPTDATLVHGDFRNGNLIVDDAGLAAVIDWELAHVGDPMEDLAWICLRTWRFKADHLRVGGFGELAALRSAYEAAGGVWREDAFHWWTVARTLWWGIGLAAQAAAFDSGLSRSIIHAASGRRVVELEYDLLTLIKPTTESDANQ